jgi:cell division protein FtsZ
MYNTKLIGVGGFGDFIIKNISNDLQAINQLDSVISINTDAQSQVNLPEGIKKLNISDTGFGSGKNPDKAYEFAKSNANTINQAVIGTDVAVIVAGIGKGTGTGATKYLTEVLKSRGIYTIVVLRTPENANESYRSSIFNNYTKAIIENADAYCEVSNDTCIKLADDSDSVVDAYRKGDDVVFDTIRGITSIINNVGPMNVDLEDFKTIVTSKFAIKTSSYDSFNTDISIYDLDTSDASSCISVIEYPTVKHATVKETMTIKSKISDSLGSDVNRIDGLIANDSIESTSVIYLVSGFDKTLSQKRAEAGRKGGEAYQPSKSKQTEYSTDIEEAKVSKF